MDMKVSAALIVVALFIWIPSGTAQEEPKRY
jgi:hypothetical protein